MTQHDPNNAEANNAQESGETRHRKHKNAYWTFVGLGIVAALVAGLASGTISAQVEQGLLPDWAIFGILTVTAILFVWFSFKFYTKVDELDLMDNLWGNTFGLYAYVIVLTGWMALHQAGVAGPPVQWLILMVTIAVALIAYTARRIGLR